MNQTTENPSGLAAPLMISILSSEMGLCEDQIFLRDENAFIPNDKRLYVAVGLMTAYPISNESFIQDATVNGQPVTQEVTRVQQRENIQVDIMSSSPEAKIRHWEIVAAMQSILSQQTQEANYFKIFRAPISFANTSGAEGGSFINRYSIVIACHVWYQKVKTLTTGSGDYYDDFTTRVDDEKTIGTDTPLIEFEINSGGIVP